MTLQPGRAGDLDPSDDLLPDGVDDREEGDVVHSGLARQDDEDVSDGLSEKERVSGRFYHTAQ